MNTHIHIDESETKRKRMSEPTAGDLFLGGKDIQNKVGRPIGVAETEDLHFREVFWAGPSVVAKL
jgi:hypothetical protein